MSNNTVGFDELLNGVGLTRNINKIPNRQMIVVCAMELLARGYSPSLNLDKSNLNIISEVADEIQSAIESKE